MFTIIRLIIGCIFLICSIVVIKKSKMVRKRILYIVFTITSSTLVILLFFLPIENFLISFHSPQAAYEYFTLGKSNVELVVEGQNCDFVVECKSDSDTYLIIPKTVDGWKVGIGLDTKIKVQKLFDGIAVYVYQYKDTNDYFITILDTNGGELDISDEYNTIFYPLEKKNDILKKTFVTYYGHISNFTSQYSVVINGNEIALEN